MTDIKKNIMQIVLSSSLFLFMNQINTLNPQQHMLWEMQRAYHEREKEAMMKTAVALAQTGKLNMEKTKAMMDALRGGSIDE